MLAQEHDMSVSLLGYSSCASFEGSIFGIEAIKRCKVNVTPSIYLPNLMLFQMYLKVHPSDKLCLLFFVHVQVYRLDFTVLYSVMLNILVGRL